MTAAGTQKARVWRELCRVETWEAYGPCSGCGRRDRTDIFFLHAITPVAKDFKMAHSDKVGARLYSALRRAGWPEGFRLLCSDCNEVAGRTFTQKEVDYVLRQLGFERDNTEAGTRFIQNEVKHLTGSN